MILDNIVTLKNLNFDYGGRSVIKDLSLDVKTGQVVAIMGGSGVGKTTLLRLIAGLINSKESQVFAFEKDVSKLNSKNLNNLRKKMGFLFQFGALFTDLSCFENVAFPIREHLELPENIIRDIVMLKLETVGLRGAADLMPFEISGGMSRRVALARAIILDPELILYDEPFAGLDPISLGVTAKLIRNLNDSLGATSILVTHDVDETFEIADKIFLLSSTDSGAVLVSSGSPEELRKDRNPLVNQFLKGDPLGPTKFHYPSEPIENMLKS
jgi:phospholipid/cholesterol/gamma-HCH transport system ATP-binding protein